MITLEDQIKYQQYWIKFKIANSHGYFRGDIILCKKTKKKYGIILGSVTRPSNTSFSPPINCYLVKVGKNAKIDSKHSINYLDLDTMKYTYTISLKYKLKNL